VATELANDIRKDILCAMKKPFAQSSYLAQVRRLRALAETAVKHYPLRVRKIEFIHHGENATFQVVAVNGRKYLLRICRNDYHTKPALLEELQWLAHLDSRGLKVPKPMRSKARHLTETVRHPDFPEGRNCCLFEWIEGKFVKALKPHHMFQVGQILADLQDNSSTRRVRHRRYWTAEGLVGAAPKFGSIDKLKNAGAHEQREITRGRKAVLRALRKYGRKFPRRQGLIHADLHFGNLIRSGKTLGAIDFDDCGYGFHVYDLVVPYLSAEGMVANKKRLPEYKNALIEGYKTRRAWDQHDEAIFEHLVMARRLLMLGWLDSRSDNPRLKKYLKKAVARALKHLREVK
jgi:Ser/Thr protein kinase RdoA (MazF antagonist)